MAYYFTYNCHTLYIYVCTERSRNNPNYKHRACVLKSSPPPSFLKASQYLSSSHLYQSLNFVRIIWKKGRDERSTLPVCSVQCLGSFYSSIYKALADRTGQVHCLKSKTAAENWTIPRLLLTDNKVGLHPDGSATF